MTPPSDHVWAYATQPGVEGALSGCTCDGCGEAFARARRWVGLRVKGQSATEIAAADGVSRQTVSRTTNLVAPSRPWKRAAKARRRAHRRPCRVCGRKLTGHGNRVAHTGRCAEVWAALRYHVDDDSREAARARSARHVLSSDGRYGQDAATAAQQAQDGTAAAHGRWMQHGSAAWDAAVEAHRERWPVFRQLPLSIRKDVIAAVSADHEDDRTEDDD